MNNKEINAIDQIERFYSYGDTPMELITDQKVKSFLPAIIVYNYDFGDGWQHIIEFEQTINDYFFNYPICNGGEGNAPPEDVGAEPGFDNFLAIINNPSHPDHNAMVEWGEMQGYQEFDIDEINMRLR
ncbi:plasmid pRiA4b ORF-3 family protein [Sutcliffiella rhizosphaerae]|uniref:Plasmid pRiA4b Orf3-like domain-containing protein n=1 Tax=Sutcliffiella rhizosphaerae TaxID=2880967 RepID=A0ABM8YML0_9BACI|nr:plasmid pRiA4b ORF-3 family protein [Sutcliffiella rhizosphaerae]CAG9621231.1 hypothetical protein BACCIP111883_02003 [Sutcliffiella rhizosphaerae]